MVTDLRGVGIEALASGDAAGALDALDRAIASGDRSPDAAVVRAAALAQLDRAADARAALHALLRDHVGFEPALDLLDQLEALVPVAAAESPVDGAWRAGAVIRDRWEVFGSAEGGMGRVWFVRDRAWDGMELAMKSLRVDVADSQARARAEKLFRQEAQVWLDLGGHPSIVSGFYTIELDEQLRFFMEFVPGRSLAQWLRAERRVSLAEALDQAIQLAAGIEYVHARGLVHRDLKPANCLVMEDRTLRITDFGLSGRADHQTGGGAAGTPSYMAPEQWRSLGEAGPPADIYAIGATLFEMLTGELPFGSERAAWDRYRDRVPPPVQRVLAAESPLPEMVLRLFHEHVAPLRCGELGAAVPEEIEATIAACMAKAPAARPTAGQLREHLLACHARHVGGYPRELPTSLAPSQIGENNRAVSYFVMGETTKARAILDEILAADATALFPWINRAALSLAATTLEPTTAAEELAHFVLPAHPEMEADHDVASFRAALAGHYVAHAAPVIALAASAGALASVTSTGEVATWRGTDEQPRRLLTLPDAAGVAFVPGGIAVAAGPLIAIIGDGGRHENVPAPGHLTALASAGPRLVGGDADGGVTVWWTDRGDSRAMRGLGAMVRAVAACPSSELIAAASLDGGFAVWDAARGAAPLLVDPAGCLSAYVSGAWGVALGGGSDGVIRIWELGSRQLIGTLAGHERAVTGLAFADDGTLLSASSDGTLRAWDVRTRRQVRSWAIHHAPIRALCVERGTIAVTAGNDQAVRRVELRRERAEPRMVVRRDTSALERRRRLDERDRVIARIRAGDMAALADAAALHRRAPELARDDALREAEHAGAAAFGVPFGVRSAYTRWTRRLPWPARSLALHPTGAGLAVAGDGGDESVIQLWDASGVQRAALQLPRVLAMAWTRDGSAVLAACLDTKVRRLAAPSLALAWTGDWASRGALRDVACGRGAEIVGSGWSRSFVRSSLQATGTIRTWAAAGDDSSSSELDRLGDEIVAISTSHDGALVAGARDNGAVSIWDLATRRRIGGELAHGGEVASLAFSRDGRRVIAASKDGAWSCWNVTTGLLYARGAHAGGLARARLWAGDRFVVTAGLDGTTRLWDRARAAVVGTLHGHRGAVLCDVGPGRELVTAGDDGLLHLWSVELDWLLGADAIADATLALTGVASRAWTASSNAVDQARDVWTDVERARGLAASWPREWNELRERVARIASGR